MRLSSTETCPTTGYIFCLLFIVSKNFVVRSHAISFACVDLFCGLSYSVGGLSYRVYSNNRSIVDPNFNLNLSNFPYKLGCKTRPRYDIPFWYSETCYESLTPLLACKTVQERRCALVWIQDQASFASWVVVGFGPCSNISYNFLLLLLRGGSRVLWFSTFHKIDDDNS